MCSFDDYLYTCVFIYRYPPSSKETMRKEGEHVKIPEFIGRKVLFFPKTGPEEDTV